MFVEALPAGIDEAASGLAGIGSAVAAGNAAGAAPTLGVVPPAPEPASVSVGGGVRHARRGVSGHSGDRVGDTRDVRRDHGRQLGRLRRDRGAQHHRDGLTRGFAAL